MNDLESALYEVSRVFLWPVLALIVLSLLYAFAMFGAFVVEGWRRRSGYRRLLPMPGLTSDDLELAILRELEGLRIVARTAPMLGLVATMIPMGPALLGLSEGDAAGIGRNLVMAFSAVILALVAASVCYLVLTVRRRWLFGDLRHIERAREGG